MAEYNNTNKEIDILKALGNVLRHKLFVFIVACLTAAAAVGYSLLFVKPAYRTASTLAVTDSRSSNGVILNLQNSIELAGVLCTMINSEEMQTAVCKEMGVEELPGTISASVIEDTNFFVMSATASSPRDSYLLFETLSEVYPQFTESVTGNAVVNVLEPAEVPQEPAGSASPLKTAAMGFLVGALLAAAITVIAFCVKDGITDKNDVTRLLNLPVAASVPYEKNGASKKRRRVSVIDSLRSLNFTEAYRDLRVTVETARAKNGASAIVVASACKKEGKTTVAANLAIALAQMGRHVLLLDFDFANPSVSAFFGASVPENAQLSDYLSESDESNKIIRKFRELPLYIAGNRFPAASFDLVTSKQAASLIAQARQRYDYVIIDTPAVSEKTDACNIAEFADAVLLVVRQEYADVHTVQNTLHALKNTGSDVLGCVLNFSAPYGRKVKRVYGGYSAIIRTDETERRVKHAK